MRRGFPRAGDVLFTTEAPLGEVAQLDSRKVALAQRLLVLRGKPSLINNTFLMHALTAREVRDQINARATGSTVRGIRQRELRKVMIPVPPFKLQCAFARRVETVERLKTAQRASLAEFDALFASLQHRAFRGKL
jgi:type I restriction enzyme S subunit